MIAHMTHETSLPSRGSPSMKSFLSAASLALLLGACSLVPDYETPEMPVSGQWPDGAAYGDSSKGEGSASLVDLNGDWRQVFLDPTLQSLIQTALENNRDLRVAALNVEAARGSYRAAGADLFPTVNAGAGFTEARTPKTASSSGKSITTDTYKANLGVTSFELDLFGRIRSLEDDALESYMGTAEARESTRLSLIAEVATAYMSLLGDQRQLTLTRETLASRADSLNLTRTSASRGVGTDLDVAQARTALETARVNLRLDTRQVALDRNALELLLGQPLPGDFPDETSGQGDDGFVADVPVGLPSEVLLTRPDIREAEHVLKAANARIGAARAAFFPSISLTGNLGTASFALSDLFTGGAAAWSFGPSISVPLFDAGRNQANLDVAKVNKEIAKAQYEKAIQTAFREVADGLASKGTLDDQIAAQRALVEATEEAYRLSRARYDSGLDSYLSVLDSQRSLYDARRDLVSLGVERLTNRVTLYKVLGGGVKAPVEVE